MDCCGGAHPASHRHVPGRHGEDRSLGQDVRPPPLPIMANVKVALRVRPLSKREHAEEARVIVNVDEKIARIRNIKLDYKPESGGDTRERLIEFGFDYCYWSVDPEDPKYASQEVIFQDLGTTVLSEAISGYNVCLFAYGQTGSGKTYTMMGTPASFGLTPRICEGLFSYNDGSPGTPSSSRIEVSFLEIYNERVRDLLHQSDQKKPYTLRVREHPEKGPYVQGLSQHVVTDYEQVVGLLEQGIENRITAATHVHDASSRSHAIFTIQYTQALLEDNLPSEIASKINLVDLAGSERASPNYCKDRLTEGSNINRSLVTLGIVISALAQNSQMSSSCQSINSILSDGDSRIPSSPSGSSATGSKRQPFVPYRDSILTWLLKDSLGGNSKTIMIATVSPASSSYNETISTLRYASNAKNIINKPRVNEDANVKLIRELREEINRLKAMLRNFEMRTISPSFNEERDGNLTELVLLNELKIEQLTKDWTDKWTDKAALMEQYNVAINKGKARVTIDSGLPHLIAMDDDILSTGVVIYYLKEGTTHIGSGDHDIVLQGEDIQEEHCVIENKSGVVELRPSLGALCRVNGQDVKDACRLSQGAIIVLGKSHRFRFNHPAEAAVLRQKRSDSRASFVSDCSLDWLDLSGDFSSSSKGSSLILSTRNSEPPSEEYQQGLRGLGATYRKQIEEQQQYVEDLKSQIQTAQVKGEKELEQEQSLINQQVQEYQQWLIKEKERLSALCQQKRESSSQTEAKTYVEVEVQNCVQTDIQPSLEEQEGKKLVQLELIRKCSLRRAERNIRRKRVKLQLERIVKKQKLLEAKKTLQQLQAACWLSDDIVKPTLLHVPKVQETSAGATALHRSSSSPSGFSFYRRCSLPWTLQALPNTYSAVLKRKCKSELTHTTKNDVVSNPLRSVSIDCLLNSSDNPGSNEQLENNPFSISTKNLQFVEEKRIDLLIKQISAGAALLSSDPQMSKKRQKMDKPRGGSKGSSNNFTAEQPKRRNIRANVSTGTKDTKPKLLKSPSPLTVGGPKKSTVQEKSKLSPKSDVGKPPPQKSVKHTQISPGQVKPPLGESIVKGKPAKYMASLKSNTQRKPAEQVNKVSSSLDNISKIANRRGENQTSNRGRISTERPNRVPLKANIQTLEDCKDDHTDSSDSESFYSVDSLSSAYASALAEQLKQEDLQRQRSNNRQKDSDSEDSQISQDSLAEKEKRKERPNKRRFNKYKTLGATYPTTSFAGEHNSFPLVTTGSVTTGLSKSFSLDSLADAEDVLEADSSEELPAEIFWKLQSPRSLILNEEDQNKENIAGPREDSGSNISNSFYLKVNDGPTPDYCDVSLPREMEYHPAILANICDETSQTICISSSSGLSTQTDTMKPNENTVHGDALSPAFVPKLECHVREDEKNHVCSTDKVSEMKSDQLPSHLEAPHRNSVQHSSVCSDPHTETQDRPPNTSAVKGEKTVQEENGQVCRPPDCDYLDRRYSTDLDSLYSGPNTSLSIPESSSDLTECKQRKPCSESEDNIASSLESAVTCSKNVTFRKEIQGEDEQLNAKRETSPMASINTNGAGKKLCSKELNEISLVDPTDMCDGKDLLNLALTQEHLHLDSTTKGVGHCTNYAMPICLHAQVENLHNPQQNISPISQETVIFGPLCSKSIQKNLSTSHFKEDDHITYCDSDAIKLLLQIQRSTVEEDINANDIKAEKETNPFQETKLISKEVNEQCLVQKQSVPDPCYEEMYVKANQIANSLCHKGEKTTVVEPTAINPSPVTELANHLVRDGCIKVATEPNSLFSNENKGLCCTIQDNSILDKNGHMADITENSSSMKYVAVRPSPNQDTVIHCIQSKSGDHGPFESTAHITNDKACSPPNERTLSETNTLESDHESLCGLKKICFICQPEGSPKSQYTIGTRHLLCSECITNKSQSNDAFFSKARSEEMQLLHETYQSESADDIIATHNHLVPACEASEQVYVSPAIVTKSSNRDLSVHDHTQYQILKEESPELSCETYPSVLNETIPVEHEKLQKFTDINSNIKYRVNFSGNTEGDHWKHCSGPETSTELGYVAEDSSADFQQERDASANHNLLEDMSATCLPLLYYEAKMQNEPFCKVKYQTESLDQGMFSGNMDCLKEVFASKQSVLSSSFPSTSTVKIATNADDIMEVDGGYQPQNADLHLSSTLKTTGCSSVMSSVDANCRFVMPKQYGGSEDSTETIATSSKSNINMHSYLQSKPESTGGLTRDTCSDGKTQEEDNLLTQTNKYGNILKTSKDERSKKGARDVCLHHYESALCTTEEENPNSESKDEDDISNARSLCNMRSDTSQDPGSEYFNKNVFPRDKNEEGAIKNCATSEMLELVTENAHARHCIEDNMYQPTCCRSSPQDLSADEVNGERDCNTGMANDLSSPMTDRNVCKVVCELKQFSDQNLAQPAHSNRVNDQVTCPVDVGDKENGDLEEKWLNTEVCGEYSLDLSDSTDISSSDTDTSRYLVVKLVDMLTGCEPKSSISKKNVNEISQSGTSEEEMSPSMDSIKTPSREHPNVLDQMNSTESDTNEFSPSPVGTLLSRSNSVGRFMKERSNLEIKSEVCAQDNMTDHHTQTVQSPYRTTNYSVLMEDVINKAYLMSSPVDEHPTNIIPGPLHQIEQSTDVVDNAESLHFSSSDINPFVHSWQQEDSPKPGWRHCAFNSACDVSCAKFREQAGKLMRCSSVDEGLNSHNSPFHSHLSSFANAKAVSSTISSLGRNDSRPDITSLDDSQELLSDESAVICTGNRAEFTGISELETKFEDHSQLDEIIFLYTSESETCNEPIKQVSGEQGAHIKHKHRKTSRHQRNHTEICSSKQMRNRNICQRPASLSSVQSMSLHLSQLLQETSELLGNLSKHHPENVSTEDIKMQRDCEDHIMKRSVRDSFTQTSVDKGIQTDSHIVKNAQNHTSERNHFLSSSGINVIVKVLGTDSLTHIPQKTEQNNSKVTKTRTQSLPNLHEFELSKQSECVVYHSPQVRASIPLLTGSQDKSSTAFPYFSSKSSSVSTNVNNCAEDMVVNSPSSSAVGTARYHTSYHEKTAMVDRASSPILTVKASNKFHYKLVPANHVNQNFAKILRNRKRKERELRDLQLNSSQTETDSESNAGNEYEAARSSSLKETTRKKVSSAKFQRFVSEGCILRDADSSFTNQSSSNSEITSSEKKCNGASYFTSMHGTKARNPWEHLQSLQNLSLMSQTLTSRDEQILRQSPKEFISDKNDLGSFTITSGNSYNKNRSYSPSQISGFDLHLQEDGLSVVESECNTDILLGQDPALKTCQKPHGYVLHDLPMHNKFSNWSGVQCGSTKNGMVNSSPNLNMRGSPTKTEASQEALDSRSQEIERLQKERAKVLSAIHLEMNTLPLTVQLAEAKLSYGIGETDALLRVLQTGKMDPQDTVSIKKQLYERHLKMIENVRKEREERLQRFRRSRSLSPQKQLSASQTSLTSLRESDLPSRRREYLQQLRRDVVDNTRIQEPKSRALQCPSEIEVMLKDYQKAREEAKTEIAKARDKLRERAEMERRRLQQGSLTKDDTKMKTLVSTSTLFTNSSLSLSSGPTSGYNSGMTATIGQGSKLSSQEKLPRSLDPALGSGRGRSAVKNYDLFTATSISVPDPHRTSSSTVESLPGKSIPCSPQRNSLLQSTAVAYQELATRVQASAMAEVMTACSYDIKKLYNHQAAAGWIYQSNEKDVLVYYKAFSSTTKHGFIGAGVIKRPIHDVWCMVKDISARRLYDQSILTACVHERVGSNIQLVHVMTDTSLCYLKQPRDFCCLAVEYKQEKCYSLCFQSVYNESMPRPNKDTVRGELLPSAWILQPDTINGEAITRVIYMVQVDLGAPAIPSRLLSVISKRQPLVIANLASFLSR